MKPACALPTVLQLDLADLQVGVEALAKRSAEALRDPEMFSFCRPSSVIWTPSSSVCRRAASA